MDVRRMWTNSGPRGSVTVTFVAGPNRWGSQGLAQGWASRTLSPMLKPRVQVRNENGVLVAEFWDCLRLDPAPVQELRKEFDVHLRRKGRPDLVVDLNGVGFAGSAALGGFLALNRLARQRDGRMVFCNVDA